MPSAAIHSSASSTATRTRRSSPASERPCAARHARPRLQRPLAEQAIGRALRALTPASVPRPHPVTTTRASRASNAHKGRYAWGLGLAVRRCGDHLVSHDSPARSAPKKRAPARFACTRRRQHARRGRKVPTDLRGQQTYWGGTRCPCGHSEYNMAFSALLALPQILHLRQPASVRA